MMRDRLTGIAAPVLAQIKDHPFWDGLRRGVLAPEALRFFAEQDARHVVPSYARALARCAAAADRDAHGALLAGAASATFGSLGRLHAELAGLPAAPPGPAGPAPEIHAYTSLMLAAPARSFAAGVGALLPMTWFHYEVGEDLRARHDPGSRYAPWIERYLPDPGFYPGYLAEFLAMVDEVAGRCTAAERDRMEQSFRWGAWYEWCFADASWHRRMWPP